MNYKRLKNNIKKFFSFWSGETIEKSNLRMPIYEWRFNYEVILVSEPKLVCEILNKKLEKDQTIKFVYFADFKDKLIVFYMEKILIENKFTINC